MKKLIMFLIIFIVISTGCSTLKTYSSEITYTTDGVPAQKEITKTLDNMTTQINGEYIIGQAPKDYISGEEKEFTTSQSGNYIAGVDFPIGVYDLVPVAGGGNVQGTDINTIMGVTGGEFYTNYYDNKEFQEGDLLKVSGVSIKLIPQTKDDFYIPAGTYNLTALEGGGNVQGSGLNEIMGANKGNMYVTNYDNANLEAGETLKVSGVSLKLEPKEKKIIVQEAKDAVPGEEITETYQISNEKNASPICKSNDKKVDCEKLNKYDELVADVENQIKENEKS